MFFSSSVFRSNKFSFDEEKRLFKNNFWTAVYFGGARGLQFKALLSLPHHPQHCWILTDDVFHRSQDSAEQTYTDRDLGFTALFSSISCSVVYVPASVQQLTAHWASPDSTRRHSAELNQPDCSFRPHLYELFQSNSFLLTILISPASQLTLPV